MYRLKRLKRQNIGVSTRGELLEFCKYPIYANISQKNREENLKLLHGDHLRPCALY